LISTATAGTHISVQPESNAGAGGAVNISGGTSLVSGAGGNVTLQGGTGIATDGAINIGTVASASVNLAKTGTLTTVKDDLKIDGLHFTSMTLDNDCTIRPRYASYMPGPYEIAAGVVLEIGNDAVFEIG